MNKGTGEGSGSGSELPGGFQSQGSAPTAPENGGAASGALWGAGEDAEGPPRGGGDALGIGCHLTVTERSGLGAEGGDTESSPSPPGAVRPHLCSHGRVSPTRAELSVASRQREMVTESQRWKGTVRIIRFQQPARNTCH